MPVRIEVDIVIPPGLTRPAPLLPHLKTAMEASVERVRAAGEGAVQPWSRARRVNKPGYGPLAGSLTTHVVTAGPTDGAAGFVRTPVFYARFLEYGTQAHALAPRRPRRVLAFEVPGGVRFRPRAQHPGLRARHWMRTAATSEVPAVQRAFEQAARAWTDAMGAGAAGA
jgi:hypothetical protein